MYKYVVHRLLLTVPILLGVSFIIFTIISLTPGDPGRLILGENAQQEAIDKLNHDLGFDRPFLVRYVKYIADVVLRLDFGTSYRTQKPVFDEIWSRLPNTLWLAVLSVIFSSIIGISLGIFAAVKQYSLLDNVLTVFAMFFAVIPIFWFGMMLTYVFSLKLGWFPTNGIGTWKNFILPTVALALNGAGGILRLTRSTMLETIRQDYVRTAKAKGATNRVVIWKHALKNALLPVITVLGINFGHLLGGTVITETVFSIPGLGTLIVSSIRLKDIPTVLSTTILFAAFFCIVVLIVDILYAYIDPRIKAKYSR
ncbi:MAG: ABC transporter permease [Synergistaceae bacterium]|jgi:peptide/nickel transport system permease protein|nr:ABC transporter permease [Synergistaceae bacterium]